MKKRNNILLSQSALFAKQIAKELKGGEILALTGPLGAGKTTFSQSLGKALKVKEHMTSPTFTIMHRFKARLPQVTVQKTLPINLYHLDLYRLKNFKEVKALGITEIWGNKDTVTLIEWADKIKKHLPKKTYYINFTHG